MSAYAYKEVAERRVRRKRDVEYGQFRRCKYKPREGDQLHLQSHMKRDFKNQGMRRMKGGKRVKCCCIVLDELLLWEILLKRKKSQIGNNVDCGQVTAEVLFSRIKRANWKKKPWEVVNNTPCLAEMMLLPGITRKGIEAYAQSKKMKRNNMIHFGEASMQRCEIMLNDLVDSKRVNTNIKKASKTGTELGEGELSIDTLTSTILSTNFWPPIQILLPSLGYPIDALNRRVNFWISKGVLREFTGTDSNANVYTLVESITDSGKNESKSS
ncbi:unnamed protein product [Microthlaspi erraticum]|uniref:Uncharacterized protein n=1 Tax=Microthlaspi erraticum TaxID=1685480 RepID=A0A6D2KSS3_9BRAS|nr:unnamed protein product [Microthlaspi erraticum]